MNSSWKIIEKVENTLILLVNRALDTQVIDMAHLPIGAVEKDREIESDNWLHLLDACVSRF